MKKFLKITAIVLITLIALVAAAVLWATLRLAHDDNGIARPTYKHYEMGQGAADGTPAPSAVARPAPAPTYAAPDFVNTNAGLGGVAGPSTTQGILGDAETAGRRSLAFFAATLG